MALADDSNIIPLSGMGLGIGRLRRHGYDRLTPGSLDAVARLTLQAHGIDPDTFSRWPPEMRQRILREIEDIQREDLQTSEARGRRLAALQDLVRAAEDLRRETETSAPSRTDPIVMAALAGRVWSGDGTFASFALQFATAMQPFVYNAAAAAYYWDGFTRMPAEEHARVLAQAQARVDRAFADAYSGDPGRGQLFSSSTADAAEALRLDQIEGRSTPERTDAVKRRGRLLEEEMTRIITRFQEINEQIRQRPELGRDPQIQQELRQMGRQIRAHHMSLGVMVQAADPEQFSFQLELLVRGGHLAREQATRLLELRERATSQPQPGESEETTRARDAARRELRTTFSEANLRMHVAERNLTGVQADEVRAWRRALDALPDTPENRQQREQLQQQIRGVMRPAWEAWANREDQRMGQLIEDADRNDAVGIAARDALAAWARWMQDLGRRMQRYEGNPQLMRQDIYDGILNARALEEYRRYQQDRQRYEQQYGTITGILDTHGVSYRLAHSPVPLTPGPVVRTGEAEQTDPTASRPVQTGQAQPSTPDSELS